MICETLDRLVDDHQTYPALALAYFALQLVEDVSVEIHRGRLQALLHIPVTVLDVMTKGLSAAIEAGDSQVLYDTMIEIGDEWHGIVDGQRRRGKPS